MGPRMSSSAASRPSVAQALAAAPALIASMTVTELFFKFGSFTLELIGCAALFGGLYGLQTLVVKAFKK